MLQGCAETDFKKRNTKDEKAKVILKSERRKAKDETPKKTKIRRKTKRHTPVMLLRYAILHLFIFFSSYLMKKNFSLFPFSMALSPQKLFSLGPPSPGTT
ncbi:unnamed protein product [Meloidogyne enterolobii]|uniref:Uncharacterized protein n=1 Tax=Meloidogyne enterolobii TaxID=390850 RepID=A0ACB1AEB8_MELEN